MKNYFYLWAATFVFLAGCGAGDGADSKPQTPNHLPALASARIEEMAYYRSSVVKVEPVGWSDQDSDAPGYFFQWYVNGTPVNGANQAEFSLENLNKGDRFSCQVTPFDSRSDGAPVMSNHIVLTGSLPAVVTASIGSGPYFKSSSIGASAQTYDEDGDAVTLAYAWTVNGQLVAGETGPTLGGGHFKRSDTVQVWVTPYETLPDGATVAGVVADSNLVVIANTPPTPPSVAVYPASATAGAPIWAEVAASSNDADGDTVAYSYTWYRNGEPQTLPSSASAVPGYLVEGGDEWTVAVTPSDAYDQGWAALAPGPAIVFGAGEKIAGSYHTCVRTAMKKTMRCWGKNLYGQLGDGSTVDSRLPVTVLLPVGSGSNDVVTKIVLGAEHSCALYLVAGVGQVSCWGRNHRGQLGDGSTIDRSTPVVVAGLTNVTGLVAGASHTCATKTDQTAVCWGDNEAGQLGTSVVDNSNTNVYFAFLNPISGRCLNLRTAENRVYLNACVGAATTDWYEERLANNEVAFHNRQTDQCMILTANQSNLTVATCNPTGSSQQRFKWTSTTKIESIAYPGYCIIQGSYGTGENNPTHGWPCNSNAEAEWYEKVTRGTLLTNDGQCVEPLGSSLADSVSVAGALCAGNEEQYWYIDTRGRIYNYKLSTQCITLSGYTTNNNNIVQVYPCQTNFETGQRWQWSGSKLASTKNTAMCLTDTSTDIFLRSCGLDGGQLFNWQNTPVNDAKVTRWFTMLSPALASRCVSANRDSNAQLRACAGTIITDFYLDPDGGMHSSGQCLTVDTAANSGGSGAYRVWLTTCQYPRPDHQIWNFSGEEVRSKWDPTSGSPGKCLDSFGGSSAEGANLIMWDCHGGANQKFQVLFPQKIKTPSGQCVDAEGESVVDQSRIVVANCNGSISEYWYVDQQGAIHNRKDSTKCLTPQNYWTNVDGNYSIIYPCTGNAAQYWTVGNSVSSQQTPNTCWEDTPGTPRLALMRTCNSSAAQAFTGVEDPTPSNDYFILINPKNAHRCIRAIDGGDYKVKVGPCLGKPDTEWYQDGNNVIHSRYNDLCLHALGSNTAPLETNPNCAGDEWRWWWSGPNLLVNWMHGTCVDDVGGADGAQVQLYFCDGANKNQYVEKLYRGQIKTADGLCVDAQGGSVADQSHIVAVGCSGGDSQYWYLDAVGRIHNYLNATKCITLQNGWTTNDNYSIIYPCQVDTYLTARFTFAGDGSVRSVADTNMCWAKSDNVNKDVLLRTCDAAVPQNQGFTFQDGAVLGTTVFGASCTAFPDPNCYSVLPRSAGLSGVQGIAAGGKTTCAIVSGPPVALKCWGSNSAGQIGNASASLSQVTPMTVALPVAPKVAAGSIAVGEQHACAVGNDGSQTAYCWGYGFGSSPAAVGTGIATLSAGLSHVCGMTAAGGVKCAGGNQYGQLGLGRTSQELLTGLVAVPGLASGVLAVSAGATHSCAFKGGAASGALLCWGDNTYGQLGNGTIGLVEAYPTDITGGWAAGVDAGDSSSCVLASDATIKCWGDNASGQLGDGTTTQRSTPVSVLDAVGSGVHPDFVAVAVGRYHACGLKNSGFLKCWGRNTEGQLGNGSTTNSSRIVDVAGADKYAMITAGEFHTCGITLSGSVMCWGKNALGQLGDTTTTNRNVPTLVPALNGQNPTFVAAGTKHTCAVLGDGTARCWGGNASGQLGDGTTTNSPVPVSVLGNQSGGDLRGIYSQKCIDIAGGNMANQAQILLWGCHGGTNQGWTMDAAGAIHSQKNYFYCLDLSNGNTTNGNAIWLYQCAAGNLNQKWTWNGSTLRSGANANKCIDIAGNGTADGTRIQIWDCIAGANAQRFTQAVTFDKIVSVATHDAHTCAINSGGAVYCWGRNVEGQLGVGDTGTYLSATRVPLPVSAKALAAGYSHTCALLGNGSVYCWGKNTDGQIGDGSSTQRNAPTAVPEFAEGGAVAIASGGDHTCAVMNGGGLKCWGRNDFGQIGNNATLMGTFSDRLSPVQVWGHTGGIVGVGAGDYHTCDNNGGWGLACWGRNDTYQLVASPNTDRLTPVGAGGGAGYEIDGGGGYSCTIGTNNEVYCAGANDRGQLGRGTTGGPATSWSQISASGTDNVDIDAGRNHACTITKNNKGLRCWGANESGQLGVGDNTDRNTPQPVKGLEGASPLSAVFGGTDHSCAQATNGKIYCWGNNDAGELGLNNGNAQESAPKEVPDLGTDNRTNVIATSQDTTCVAKTGGGVKCFGRNDAAQTGSNFPTNHWQPYFVMGEWPSGSNWMGLIDKIAGGAYHMCANGNPGSLYCWGRDASSQMGGFINNTAFDKAHRVVFDGVTDQDAKHNNTCVVQNGGVFCTGENNQGQLGRGFTSANGRFYYQIRAEYNGRCIDDTGADLNGNPWLHLWTCDATQSNPNQGWRFELMGEDSGVPYYRIHAGRDDSKCWNYYTGSHELHTYACETGNNNYWKFQFLNGFWRITSRQDGNCIDAWGGTGGSDGQKLGVWSNNCNQDNQKFFRAQTNSKVVGLHAGSGVTKVSVGQEFACALKTSNTVVTCWGDNAYGQLGDTSVTDRSASQTTVSGLPAGTISMITSGATHSCALIGNPGSVYCWGRNNWGQLGDGTSTNRSAAVYVRDESGTQLSNFTWVGAGWEHTCAITSTGAGYCWGNPNNWRMAAVKYAWTAPHPNPLPIGGNQVLTSGNTGGVPSDTSVSAGASHICAIKADGTVWCTGANDKGQLGNNSTVVANQIVNASGVASARTVAAGSAHSCATEGSPGAIKCWGANDDGQLGRGNFTDSLVPVAVSGIANAIKVVAGGYHTCAILDTNPDTIRCWGRNDHGQLGDGTRVSANTPISVASLSGVVALTAGLNHTCAVLSSGATKCWGSNSNGQVGDGVTNAPISTPQDTLYAPNGAYLGSSVSMGKNHTCAVSSAGAALCWGDNSYGQIGDGIDSDYSFRGAMTAVFGLGSGVAEVKAGGNFSCARTTAGEVKCWGDNSFGQLGQGSVGLTEWMPVTVDLGSGLTATRLVAGDMFACAALSDNTVKCWGNNYVRQLGSGTTNNIESRPVLVSGLTGVSALSAGTYHACALVSGAAKCWGFNGHGQIGNGTTAQQTTPVAVSGLSSGVTAIVAGEHHTCAIQGGAAVCWGNDAYGQLGAGDLGGDGYKNDPDILTPSPVSGLASGVANITAYGHHTCVTTSVDGAKCWGDNAGGQLGGGAGGDEASPVGVPGLNSGAKDIFTGWGTTCSKDPNGATRCWGDRSVGQIPMWGPRQALVNY